MTPTIKASPADLAPIEVVNLRPSPLPRFDECEWLTFGEEAATSEFTHRIDWKDGRVEYFASEGDAIDGGFSQIPSWCKLSDDGHFYEPGEDTYGTLVELELDEMGAP